jgi:hypothetical protein
MRARVIFGLAAAAMGSTTALAAPSADGLVSASVELTGSREDVEKLLGNAAATVRMSPDVTTVTATPHGNCERLAIEAKGPMGPLNLVSMRCRDGNGWTETLVSSDDFERHEVHWQLEDTPTGTRLTVRAAVTPDFPVPQRLVDAALQSSLVQQLSRIKAFLAD